MIKKQGTANWGLRPGKKTVATLPTMTIGKINAAIRRLSGVAQCAPLDGPPRRFPARGVCRDGKPSLVRGLVLRAE